MKRLLFTALLMSGFVAHAQEPKACMQEFKATHQHNNQDTMTAKDFIVAGVIGGCAIELANVIRKDENYKKVLAFAADYPGVFVVGVSASAGLIYIYGKGIKNFLSRYRLVSKQA